MNAESKFTPGPWRSNGPTGPNMQGYKQPFCIAGTGEYASTLIAGCFGDTKGGIESAGANARLIAAAPALLEALKELEGCIAYSDTAGHWYLIGRDRTLPALGKARAILAALQSST